MGSWGTNSVTNCYWIATLQFGGGMTRARALVPKEFVRPSVASAPVKNQLAAVFVSAKVERQTAFEWGRADRHLRSFQLLIDVGVEWSRTDFVFLPGVVCLSLGLSVEEEVSQQFEHRHQIATNSALRKHLSTMPLICMPHWKRHRYTQYGRIAKDSEAFWA